MYPENKIVDEIEGDKFGSVYLFNQIISLFLIKEYDDNVIMGRTMSNLFCYPTDPDYSRFLSSLIYSPGYVTFEQESLYH